MSKKEQYIAIDLKSFYASAECVLRELDPLTTNLVVADESRTEKTICLAVSPSLKAYGIAGRARLFEVVQRVKEINDLRKAGIKGHTFRGKSWDDNVLKRQPDMAIDYIVAPPRMAWYMEFSSRIYQIYLQHVAPEDIHVYSIDEVFIYATPYLRGGSIPAREFAEKLMKQVYRETGITATAGIGTNLFLCKAAMDIMAKKALPDAHGMRIAELDERSFRENLWNHRPITDFWRVGRGSAARLEKYGLFTMGDIARCSLGKPDDFYNEELLFNIFGIQAELLIDHAWGIEPCRMEHIKAYKPASNSLSSGQVLPEPYSYEKARLVVREMADNVALDLTEKGLVTNQLTLTVNYDRESLTNRTIRERYTGQITRDYYGRTVPKHAHGTVNLTAPTASSRLVTQAVLSVFDREVNPDLLVRRLTIGAIVLRREDVPKEAPMQLNLFETPEPPTDDSRDLKRQEAMLQIKRRFGKNAILRGMNLEEGATARQRNEQIGGHKA